MTNRLRSMLVAAAAAVAIPAVSRAGVSYVADLLPANNSGVTGTARLDLDGNRLTVSIDATGLQPNRPHQQEIHGFVNDKPSTKPGPALDFNNNGLIDLYEAELTIGPIILPLVDDDQPPQQGGDPNAFPTAQNGTIDFERTYTLKADLPAALNPLEIRADRPARPDGGRRVRRDAAGRQRPVPTRRRRHGWRRR